MPCQTTVEEWNKMVLSVVQSMLGAISENFRMVAISRHDDSWKILFFLETDNPVDREEIADILSELDALQDRYTKFESDVIVTGEFIPWPEPPTRVVFRRREAI